MMKSFLKWIGGLLLLVLAAMAGHAGAKAVLPPQKTVLMNTISAGEKVLVSGSNEVPGGRSQRQLRDALFRAENGLPVFTGKPGDPAKISPGTQGLVVEEDAGMALVRFKLPGWEELVWVPVGALNRTGRVEKGD